MGCSLVVDFYSIAGGKGGRVPPVCQLIRWRWCPWKPTRPDAWCSPCGSPLQCGRWHERQSSGSGADRCSCRPQGSDGQTGGVAVESWSVSLVDLISVAESLGALPFPCASASSGTDQNIILPIGVLQNVIIADALIVAGVGAGAGGVGAGGVDHQGRRWLTGSV